jgi:hypothetical protein
MIISGGFDDTSSQSLNDTWAFHGSRGEWKQMSCGAAPALEGHKSIVSGFDVFSFGGHTGPGAYESRTMSLHALSLGMWNTTLPQHLANLESQLDGDNDAEDSGQSDSSSDNDERIAVVQLPDGQLVPLRVLQALLRRRLRTQDENEENEANAENEDTEEMQ